MSESAKKTKQEQEEANRNNRRKELKQQAPLIENPAYTVRLRWIRDK